MLCKKLLSVIIAGVLFFSLSTSAYAELFSISAGVPTKFSFSDSNTKSDGTPTGLLAHINFPVLGGIGYEGYTVPIKTTGTDVKAAYALYDLFYLLPIPVINITLGLGFGTASIGGDTASSYDSGVATQYYGQIGFPIFGVVDLHLSYHSVSGTAKGKSGVTDADLSGSMTAIGMSFGF